MKKSISVTLVIFLAVAIFFGILKVYEIMNRVDYNPESETISSKNVKTASDSRKIFETEYFKFIASNDWKESVGEKNVYTYRKINGSNVDQVFSVTINKALEGESPTRILPISQNQNYSLSIGDVSTHCGSMNGNKKQRMTLDQVEFDCFGDDTRYSVSVGLKNGNTEMNLKRPDGGIATYEINFKDNSFKSDSDQLKKIMSTFIVK